MFDVHILLMGRAELIDEIMRLNEALDEAHEALNDLRREIDLLCNERSTTRKE